jgi:hypothetical protein
MTIAWILLVLASLVLIAYGIVRAGWHIWRPAPGDMEESWTGGRYVYAGCALSFTAAVWSGIRGNQVWVRPRLGPIQVIHGWKLGAAGVAPWQQ